MKAPGHVVRPDGTINPHWTRHNGLQKRLRELYLEYVNDHLNLFHIAEYYGLTRLTWIELIHIGKITQNLEHE